MDDLERAAARLLLHLAAYREPSPSAARDGVGVILPYVSVSEIEELDGSIRNLNSDVMALVGGVDATELATNLPALVEKWGPEKTAFAAAWASYYARWRAWDQDHYGEWSRSGDAVRAEFDRFGAEYNEQLRAFKEKFGEDKTDAKPVEPPSGGPGGSTGLGQIVDLAFFGLAVFAGYQVIKLWKDR